MPDLAGRCRCDHTYNLPLPSPRKQLIHLKNIMFMKLLIRVLSVLSPTLQLALAGDLLGGFVHVNIQAGGRRLFEDPPAEVRPALAAPDQRPHGYPPGLADLSFEDRVRELARPRLIAVNREGANARPPEWREATGETWAKDYLRELAAHAGSRRRNLFALDPSMAAKGLELDRELVVGREQTDPVDQLFLQARLAYAKSVSVALSPNPQSPWVDRERKFKELRDEKARLEIAVGVDESFGDATGAAAKRRQLADLSLRCVILKTEIETIEASDRLAGDSQRICRACIRFGNPGPGGLLMGAVVDALGVVEPADHERWWIRRELPKRRRFDLVVQHLKAQAVKHAAEPALVTRSVELGRELQAIDDLEAQGNWEETQALCLALWDRINHAPSEKATK